MALQSDKLRLLRRIPEIRFEEELRGYSKQQVDRVLENLAPLADEIESLQNRLAEAETRAAGAEARLLESSGRESDIAAPAIVAQALPVTPADFDETLRNTLLLAQRAADETVRRANEDAAQLGAQAAADAEQMLASARAESAQLEADIEARRAELLADVDAERSQLLDEIRAAASARRAAIEQELTQTEGAERAELLSQIEDLQGIRSMLLDDVEILEQHLDARRNAIREALIEIGNVIDQPDRLHGDVPNVSDVEAAAGSAVASLPANDLHGVTVAAPLLDELVAEEDGGSSVLQDDASSDATDLGAPTDEGFLLEVSPATTLAAPVFVEPTALEAGPATQEISAVPLEATSENPSEAEGPSAEAAPFDFAATAGRAPVRPTWADAVPDADELLDVPSSIVTAEGESTKSSSTSVMSSSPQDPFLDQLRRATSEDFEGDDDALDRFLEGDPEGDRRNSGGWFGRRK